MWPIEKRCQRRDTAAFVAPETVDLLGEKMIGIIADRRMTKMHRYLGENAGTPRLFPGLRLWHGGFNGPTYARPRMSASVSLASGLYPYEGIGIGFADETEAHVRDRYHHPEKHWLGQRRDITFVELDGWPGSPGRDDRIRIEHWNSNGVGQETILVFDDVDHIQELAWEVQGSKERHVYMDDGWCTTHDRHFEDPDHASQIGRCALRRATVVENLRVLVGLAEQREQSGGVS